MFIITPFYRRFYHPVGASASAVAAVTDGCILLQTFAIYARSTVARLVVRHAGGRIEHSERSDHHFELASAMSALAKKHGSIGSLSARVKTTKRLEYLQQHAPQAPPTANIGLAHGITNTVRAM
jgi:hypothetical protein